MKSNISTKNFYDDLSSDYHLIFENWDESVVEQGKILNDIIRNNSRFVPKTILDCSCGIGTQSIGLAQYNYLVTGTDLSTKAIERAKTEAKKRNLEIKFGIADFMKLEKEVKGTFDTVISCDNSLTHLLTNDSLLTASKNIHLKLNSNGLFIGSIRDYDTLLNEKPISTTPNIKTTKERRTISFQIWDWKSDRTYVVNHFTIKGNDDNYNTFHRTSQYRAFTRNEITTIFQQAGFSEVKWLMPIESAYYQPIILAYK